ncbi:hypothetical protein ATE49_04865 [Elizabethkingia miricola]|uniref:Uncharacterized protein n=1 Tax=Elizabethkingia miricola TaxID=172045 RepID=A0ABY3NG54_ELIMR|nr:hypothetical protein [Elizabethkingia miricola]OBS12556.1 hypothetical protein ATE49_04865 [Elizabethkingia miricola]TYO91965.1 hypothetical protein LX74_02216 [Elizabethkingia miricola]
MRITISTSEYNKLISIARSKFPNCYEDVVHDAVLLELDFKGCLSKIKGFSYSYRTVKEVDLTNNYQEKVCTKCNKCLPIAFFALKESRNVIYTRNVCKTCINIQQKEWRNNNPEKFKKSRRAYDERNKEQKRARNKKWEDKNRDYRKEYMRQWYVKNKKKKDEYTVQYLAKKKLEKLTLKQI